MTDSSSGLFLAFEGVEGSGKSTQARLLVEHLQSRGNEVIYAREPGSTPLGERVRNIVLNDRDLHVPPRSELFLMLAARAAFVEGVVQPALARGAIVVADRFELSTLAYQGAGRGLPIEEVVDINRFATGGLNPDLTLFLDLDPDEGSRRQGAASKQLDRMEREEAAFHQRVARGYRELAAIVEGLVRIDASGSVDDVHALVLNALSHLAVETFPQRGVII